MSFLYQEQISLQFSKTKGLICT